MPLPPHSIPTTRIILSVLLLLLAPSVFAKSFFWEVNSANATVYLLGSIHVANKDFYPLPAIIEQGFERADALVVEIDASKLDTAEVEQSFLAKALYPGDESLSEHISKITLDKLSTYLAQNNLPMQAFAKMKPGMVAMTLSMAKMADLGYTADYGIDMYFLHKAKAVKPILELERYQDQLALLLSLPNTDIYLQYTLEQLSDIKAQLDFIVDAWKNGDAKKLEQMVIIDAQKEFPDMAAINDRLFVQRNIKMTDQIRAYLDTPKTYFVVVGAGHLVGQQGIIALLQKYGLRTTQH